MVLGFWYVFFRFSFCGELNDKCCDCRRISFWKQEVKSK